MYIKQQDEVVIYESVFEQATMSVFSGTLDNSSFASVDRALWIAI